MNTSTQTASSVVEMISSLGPVGLTIFMTLMFASTLSWAIIFFKWSTIRRSTRQNNDFLSLFWNGKNIEEVFTQIDQFQNSSVASVFKSGFKELQKLNREEKTSADPEVIHNITRALARASSTEIAGLEKHVNWLATIASAAPFVGLFGTVWGIMNSFRSIGALGSANLAVVAPGISEALVNTATGLAAAIPAVIAYNHFASQIKRIAVDIDCFTQDFLNLIQRGLLTNRKGSL